MDKYYKSTLLECIKDIRIKLTELDLHLSREPSDKTVKKWRKLLDRPTNDLSEIILDLLQKNDTQ